MFLPESISHAFAPITLEEMDDVSLLDRVDTKFIAHKSIVPILLRAIEKNYRMLEIGGKRISAYHNRYFDTQELKLYHEHHRGKKKRYKVRVRTYVDSNLTFLEIKKKDQKGVTRKKRRRTDSYASDFSTEQISFLEEIAGNTCTLQSSLINTFDRATFVDVNLTERVTIDGNVQFNQSHSLGNGDLIIIEIKQAGLNRFSPVMIQLKKMGVYPYKVSKYCLGMAATRPQLKQNLWKRKFLKINKIVNQGGVY